MIALLLGLVAAGGGCWWWFQHRPQPVARSPRREPVVGDIANPRLDLGPDRRR